MKVSVVVYLLQHEEYCGWNEPPARTVTTSGDADQQCVKGVRFLFSG